MNAFRANIKANTSWKHPGRLNDDKRSRKMNKWYKGGYKSGLYESDDYYVVNGEYGLEIHAKDPANEIYVASFPTFIKN